MGLLINDLQEVTLGELQEFCRAVPGTPSWAGVQTPLKDLPGDRDSSAMAGMNLCRAGVQTPLKDVIGDRDSSCHGWVGRCVG